MCIFYKIYLFRLVGSPVKGGMGDIDEMDAWEISMRLDMAHIQKKYRY